MSPDSPDDPKCEAVEDDEQEEGDQSHHHEVGDEQVVPAVGVAVPELSSAHLQWEKWKWLSFSENKSLKESLV